MAHSMASCVVYFFLQNNSILPTKFQIPNSNHITKNPFHRHAFWVKQGFPHAFGAVTLRKISSYLTIHILIPENFNLAIFLKAFFVLPEYV